MHYYLYQMVTAFFWLGPSVLIQVVFEIVYIFNRRKDQMELRYTYAMIQQVYDMYLTELANNPQADFTAMFNGDFTVETIENWLKQRDNHLDSKKKQLFYRIYYLLLHVLTFLLAIIIIYSFFVKFLGFRTIYYDSYEFENNSMFAYLNVEKDNYPKNDKNKLIPIDDSYMLNTPSAILNQLFLIPNLNKINLNQSNFFKIDTSFNYNIISDIYTLLSYSYLNPFGQNSITYYSLTFYSNSYTYFLEYVSVDGLYYFYNYVYEYLMALQFYLVFGLEYLLITCVGTYLMLEVSITTYFINNIYNTIYGAAVGFIGIAFKVILALLVAYIMLYPIYLNIEFENTRQSNNNLVIGEGDMEGEGEEKDKGNTIHKKEELEQCEKEKENTNLKVRNSIYKILFCQWFEDYLENLEISFRQHFWIAGKPLDKEYERFGKIIYIFELLYILTNKIVYYLGKIFLFVRSVVTKTDTANSNQNLSKNQIYNTKFNNENMYLRGLMTILYAIRTFKDAFKRVFGFSSIIWIFGIKLEPIDYELYSQSVYDSNKHSNQSDSNPNSEEKEKYDLNEKGEDADDNCPICYNELGMFYLISKCNHRFHYSCLNQWVNKDKNVDDNNTQITNPMAQLNNLQVKVTCPCCRREYKSLMDIIVDVPLMQTALLLAFVILCVFIIANFNEITIRLNLIRIYNTNCLWKGSSYFSELWTSIQSQESMYHYLYKDWGFNNLLVVYTDFIRKMDTLDKSDNKYMETMIKVFEEEFRNGLMNTRCGMQRDTSCKSSLRAEYMLSALLYETFMRIN